MALHLGAYALTFAMIKESLSCTSDISQYQFPLLMTDGLRWYLTSVLPI